MRRALSAMIVFVVLGSSAPAAHARPPWKKRIDRLVAHKQIGLEVRQGGKPVYRHRAQRARIPASNQKLLMAMALFDILGPEAQLETELYLDAPPVGGIVKGNLWIAGRGDPAITAGGRFGNSLPFPPTRLNGLARAIDRAGIDKITGTVMGSTGYFARDWFAPGWKRSFPARYAPLASALTFEGNTHAGRHIDDPEIRAARALRRKLRARGITVTRRAGAGKMPTGLHLLSTTPSQRLSTLVRYTSRWSSNFFAEMLGKSLGVEASGAPGTIAKGAAAVERWAADRGVALDAYDSSGLSYANRVSARGMVRLLEKASAEPWGRVLRRALPTGGQGTLKDRLRGAPVRAKTGSLDEVSALSGWVWLRRTGRWAELSILSSGLSYSRAKRVEDRIVRLLIRKARGYASTETGPQSHDNASSAPSSDATSTSSQSQIEHLSPVVAPRGITSLMGPI